MTITSIGSSFTTPVPVQAPNPATPAERIVVSTAKSDADNQDQQSGGGGQRSSSRLTAVTVREEQPRSSLGTLISAQEETRSKPAVSARAATSAYAAAG